MNYFWTRNDRFYHEYSYSKFYYEYNKEQEEGVVDNFDKMNEKVMNFYKDLLLPLNNQPFVVSNEQLSKMKRNKKNKKNEKSEESEKNKENVKVRNALNKETTADRKTRYSIHIKEDKGVKNI